MTTYHTIAVDGVDIFYREAGSRSAPTILLLHGFPTSSHMFRNLIPALADQFHLVAPDYPGFGNSSMPDLESFDYSFDRLADVLEQFIGALNINRFSLYMQDYGGPVGFRLVTRHPEWIEALIIQNAVAYQEGLGEGFNPIKDLWQARNNETEQTIRDLLTTEFTKLQYTAGSQQPERLSPDAWAVDQYFLNRPGNDTIQIQLQYDYRHNLELYPQWQAYLRKHQPPTLIVWGKNDIFFRTAGALAYQQDLEEVELHLLDAGHFALEEEGEAIADYIRQFMAKRSQPSAV